MFNITSCEEKAFYLVHTRKQLISCIYVNALNATFAMGFFLEGGVATFGSGVELVVACEQVLQSKMGQRERWKKTIEESRGGERERTPQIPSPSLLDHFT